MSGPEFPGSKNTMKKKRTKTVTTRSQVRNIIRRYIWLRSPERRQCLKNARNRCEVCNRKFTKAAGYELPPEVHHLDGIDGWEEIIDLIFAKILTTPDKLKALCGDCHDQVHPERVKKVSISPATGKTGACTGQRSGQAEFLALSGIVAIPEVCHGK